MGAADWDIEQVGCGCPELGTYLLGNGSVGHAVRVRNVGHYTPHWECLGNIPPQGGPQAYREATSERKVRHIGIPPARGHNGGCGITGGGYLRLPSLEHSHIVYCNQAHYGPVSGGGAEAGVKGG